MQTASATNSINITWPFPFVEQTRSTSSMGVRKRDKRTQQARTEPKPTKNNVQKSFDIKRLDQYVFLMKGLTKKGWIDKIKTQISDTTFVKTSVPFFPPLAHTKILRQLYNSHK